MKQEAARIACRVGWANCYHQRLFVPMGARNSSVLSPTQFAACICDIVSQLPFIIYRFIVLYADDILLMAAPVTELQGLLTTSETELKWQAMTIKVKNYCFIGSRYSVNIIVFATRMLFRPYLVEPESVLRLGEAQGSHLDIG